MTGKSLQLSKYGTAATANVQTSPTDTTAGRLMAVGAFGVGGSLNYRNNEIRTSFRNLFADGRSSITPAIVLLSKIGTSGKKIAGTITCGRSTASSATDQAKIEIAFATNGNGAIRAFSVAVLGSRNLSFNPLTVTFEGETWAALDTSTTTGHSYPSGYIFDGYITGTELSVVDRSSCTDITPYTGNRNNFDYNGNTVYHTGNILGTVSQDAIIETGGSDTEGTYTLLKNGLVIFNRVETDFNIEVNNGSGSVFVSPGTDYRFSYPFIISKPVTTSVRVYAANGGNPVMWAGDPITNTSSHTTAWRFRVVAGSSISSATVSVHLTAIGYI